MDSVLIHFQLLLPEELEQRINNLGGVEVGNGRWSFQERDVYFFLDMYSSEEIHNEYEPTELEQLITTLDGFPTCSLVISSRYGPCAHKALEFVLRLTDGTNAIMDDDHGRLWTIEDLQAHYLSSPGASIFIFDDQGS